MSSAVQILWIGAGSGEAFQPASGCKRIIAVEARSEACQQLLKLQQRIPQLEVIETLVSTQDGQEHFYSYNIAALSANQKGSGLKALFPGLKLVAEEQLAAKSLANLVTELKLDFTTSCALWLHTPANALALVKHLAEQKLLAKFSELQFCWPAEALYDNYSPQAEALQWLASQCFDLYHTNNTDPDLPIFSFRLNKLKLELQQKNWQIKQKDTELSQLKTAQQTALDEIAVLKQQQQQAEQQKADLATKAQQEAAAKAELQKQLEALKQQQTAVQQQAEQQKAELTAQIQREAAAKSDLQKQLEAFKQKQTAQQQQAEQQNAELTAKAQQEAVAKAELQKQLDALKQQHTEQQQQAEQQKAELIATVQQEAVAKAELQKQLDALKQQHTEQQQQAEQQKAEFAAKVQQEVTAKAELQKQLDALKQQLATQQQQSEQQKTELTAKAQQEAVAKAELQKQLEALKQQINHLQKIADDNATLLQQEKKEHAACKEKFSETHGWFVSRKKQAEDTLVLLEAAKQELEILKAKQNANEMLTDLQKNMHELFASQAKQLQQATNALGQHIAKTQVEQLNNVHNFFGLQQFLQHGEPLLQLSPWSIQPDTLNQIIKLLNSNNYDAIIEFGSGESTVVLAKALFNQCLILNQVPGGTKIQLPNRGKSNELQTKKLANDLPARIISFEQNESFYKQTELTLNQHGVEHLVDLVCSPLVPSACADLVDDKKPQLFYDCMEKLGQLKRLLPSQKAKLLIIVDGPVSPADYPLIRYAALPSVLHYFSASQLHVVLDDAKRTNEKQVLDLWQALCKDRGLQFTTVDWQTNKGAVLLEINP